MAQEKCHHFRGPIWGDLAIQIPYFGLDISLIPITKTSNIPYSISHIPPRFDEAQFLRTCTKRNVCTDVRKITQI